VEYTERMARLDEVSWPKPLEEDLEAALEIYARTRSWVRVEDLSPKSVVREIYETGQTFSEFVQRYGLQRSEGIVLRYLSDAYQAMRRTIPQDLRTEGLEDRKSTRLNSSHVSISYAVFCLKKKNSYD